MPENAVEQMDEAAYLESKFGVKTVDEVTDLIKKGKEAPATPDGFAEKLTAAEQKALELTGTLTTKDQEIAQLKAQPPMQPYKHDMAKFVDDLFEKGLEPDQVVEAIKWSGVDVSKLSPSDKIKLAAKLENKGWGDDHAEAFFNKEYTVDPDDTTITDTDKKLKEAKMITASTKSEEFLKGFIGKKFEAKKDPTAEQRALDLAAKQTHLNTYWGSKTPVVIDGLKKLSGDFTAKLPGAKGIVDVPVKFDFTLPDTDLASLKTEMTQTAVRSMVADNQEGETWLKTVATGVIKARYNDKLMENGLIALQNAYIDHMKKEFHVEMPSSSVDTSNKGGAGDGKNKSWEDAVLEKEMKQKTRR